MSPTATLSTEDTDINNVSWRAAGPEPDEDNTASAPLAVGHFHFLSSKLKAHEHIAAHISQCRVQTQQ